MWLAEDAVGTAKTFPVSKILEVVLKYKKNYLMYTPTNEFTSLLLKRLKWK